LIVGGLSTIGLWAADLPASRSLLTFATGGLALTGALTFDLDVFFGACSAAAFVAIGLSIFIFSLLCFVTARFDSTATLGFEALLTGFALDSGLARLAPLFCFAASTDELGNKPVRFVVPDSLAASGLNLIVFFERVVAMFIPSDAE
jgi:hypothetical protein